MWTFYMGVHNGEHGNTPTYKYEFVEKLETDGTGATKLLRIMKEMFLFFTHGMKPEK